MAYSPAAQTPSDLSPKDTEVENVADHGGISRLIKEHGHDTVMHGILGTVGAIGNGAMMPLFILFFGKVINIGTATDVNYKEEGLKMLTAFLLIGAGYLVFNALQYICWGIYGAKISVRARETYFRSLLRQDMGYFDENNSGAINTELISDCLYIAGMGTAMGLVIQHTITSIGGFVLAFYYSWEISIVLMAASPLFVAVGMVSAWFQKQGAGGGLRGEDTKKTVDPKAAAGAFSNEVLVSIRTVKSMPVLLRQKLAEYEEKLADILPFAKKSAMGAGLGIGGMMFSFFGVLYPLGLWYGGRKVDDGTVEIGDMIFCMWMIPTGAMSVGQLGTAMADIVKARVGANKMFAVKDRVPAIRPPSVSLSPRLEPKLKGSIEFKNVNFAYPSAPDTAVLNDLSFTIGAGETLAIVGPSGSGKSTVIALLERYYDPLSGSVLVDGSLIHNLSMEHLRRNIGYVSQLPLLFAESIKENIRGGNPSISDEEVEAAAKLADAHDFIKKLDGGYDTNVGEMGNRLSGGQKQRIAIARAIATKPAILLLDEATSALDTKSEREVQRAIDKIAANRSQTIVVIAHRLSTIKNADKILVLVDGAKEEEGGHQRLIQNNGLYAVLVREQMVTDIERSGGDDEQFDANANPIANAGGLHSDRMVAVDLGDSTSPSADGRNLSAEPLFEGNNTMTATSIVPVDGTNTDSDGEEGDCNNAEDKDEAAIPNLGGTKRLAAEYAKEHRCLFYSAAFFSILAGAVMPCFAVLFPRIFKVLSEQGTVITVNADTVDGDGLWSTTGSAITSTSWSTNYEEAATELVLMFVAMGVYAFVAWFFQNFIFTIYGTKLANAVKRDWFTAILNQEISYHDEEGSGNLNSNLTAETQTIAEGMGQKLGLLLQSIVQGLLGLGIAFYHSWEISLVFVGLCPLMVVSGVLESMKWHGSGSSNADPFLDSGTVSQEILTNIRTVLAFPDLITTKTKKFEDELAKGEPIALKRAAVSGASMGINLFIAQGVIYGVGMYVGLRFIGISDIDVTFDEVIGAFFGITFAGTGLGQAASVMPDLQKANLAANKFYAIKERQPAVRGPTDGMKAIESSSKLKGDIEFKNVSFSYSSAPGIKVLDGVSVSIPSGSSLAIVGPSGSGKSTMISLMERFYDYDGGSIVMDGEHEINDYDLSYLRSSIGLVSQMPLLFDASVSDNIRGGLASATAEDIEAAAKSANAHDFIMKLDAGYETKVGELGGKLSGGQRQRIAIARALLPKPSILLLDEATSALDSKSEKEVQSAIDSITASGQQTTITIAHRLSTIQNSDHILVLVDGKVKEQGDHKQLMDRGGVYAALVDAQSLVEKKKEFHRQRSAERVESRSRDCGHSADDDVTVTITVQE